MMKKQKRYQEDLWRSSNREILYWTLCYRSSRSEKLQDPFPQEMPLTPSLWDIFCHGKLFFHFLRPLVMNLAPSTPSISRPTDIWMLSLVTCSDYCPRQLHRTRKYS